MNMKWIILNGVISDVDNRDINKPSTHEQYPKFFHLTTYNRNIGKIQSALCSHRSIEHSYVHILSH